MASLRSTVTAFVASLLYIAQTCTAAVLPDGAVGVEWTFENVTWIENLAVRQNGGVLTTSINRAAVYLVDPFEHTACQVVQFDPTDGALGITEIENDVFVVATSNISLTTSTSYPGSAKLWKIDMAAYDLGQPDVVTLIANLTDVGLTDGVVSLPGDKGAVLLADAAKGLIWRIDVNTGEYVVAIDNPLFKVSNPLIPLGVDGVHILDDVLYFTNLGLNLLAKIPITDNGTATGPAQNISDQLTFVDDFAVAGDGTIYAAGDNTLWKVSPNGSVEIFAGGPNDLALEGVTSAQLGRTHDDAGVLYLGTNGGLLSQVDGMLHGGQLLALNVGA